MPDPTSPPPKGLHAPTDVLTRGFDPALSVGSARPAVFRSSTYVFPSPEAAERAFDLVAGRARPEPGESVALIYSRFNLGADLVLYSATKYLSGFSDLLGGVALARDRELLSRVKLLRNLFGTILQPDECWILNSRLPTVDLRMRKASKNARRIAEALAKHSRVARVLHPAHFDDFEQCAIRDAQCDAPGAMLSLELKGGKPAAFDFLRRLRIARNAVSLGGVETLVCHPKTTTHSGFREEEFAAAGVTDGLVRISVGIEDWRDLVGDFEQALG